MVFLQRVLCTSAVGSIGANPMITLTLGTRIKDNDPRLEIVVKTIDRYWSRAAGSTTDPADATHVITCTGQTRIRIDRIHTDGKIRRSGWSVVK